MNMNTKVISGITVVVVALGVGIYVQNRAAPIVPASGETSVVPTSTTSASTTAQSPQALPAKKPSVGPKVEIISAVASVDSSSLVSTSAYPVVTGTANVSRVGVIVYDALGVGIVGTGNIIVKNGRWSYSVSVALKPGVYSIVLFGGAANATSTLTVKNP